MVANIIQYVFAVIGGTGAGPTALTAVPRLAPLADNGGPTPTMALLPGSPGIDAAMGSTNAVDQRGFSVAGPPDIGAFEAGGSAAAPAPGVTPTQPDR